MRPLAATWSMIRISEVLRCKINSNKYFIIISDKNLIYNKTKIKVAFKLIDYYFQVKLYRTQLASLPAYHATLANQKYINKTDRNPAPRLTVESWNIV